MNQPIKYHGGKGAFNGKLAKWIISLMPKHTHYVEPFFGGGSVLLYKDVGASEVVNDLNEDLINFWKVLRDTPDRMLRYLWGTPFAEDSWNESFVTLKDTDRVRRATAFFIKMRQSRQGLGKSFATMSKTRTRQEINEQASSYWSAIEGLPEIHQRLRGVVIFNKPAIELIKQEDNENTLFYCDPPYLHTTRKTTKDYEHEMSETDHENLLKSLGDLAGHFLLSGYKSDLYNDYASQFGWKLHEFKIVNNSSGSKEKEIKTECVWSN